MALTGPMRGWRAQVWIAANNSRSNFSPVPGPAAAGLVGFASGGALGSLQNVLPSTYVTTTTSPAFPINNTNVLMVAWIYPKTNLSNHAGLITMRAGTARATQTDGFATGLASGHGYIWTITPPAPRFLLPVRPSL